MQVFRSTPEEWLIPDDNVARVSSSARAVPVNISVDPTLTYQTLDGFGASFTDSSAYLIDRVLTPDDREAALTLLFDPEEGIGLSVVRNPMGASDYARHIYSYDDMPEGEVDPDLKHFSIAHDEESILPLTRVAIEKNPRVKVFATPWSAPGWMKTSGKMVTGKLKPEWYAAYARYFVAYVQACGSAGVPIHGVSPQNEPLFVPDNYPGMEVLAHEEIIFVRDYLRPAFKGAGLGTRIYGYDHNWDRVDYPFDLLDQAADDFDGIAWHWYGGQPVSQSRVQHDYPDKEVHLFEASGGEWIPTPDPAFSNLVRTGIDILRNGSQSLVLWNAALDENNGPTVPDFGTSTCRGLLRIDQRDATFSTTVDYVGLAHFSKFARPGARRVESTQTSVVANSFSSEVGMVRSVSFINEDGSLALTLLNDSSETVAASVMLGSVPLHGQLSMQPHSALSLRVDSKEFPRD